MAGALLLFVTACADFGPRGASAASVVVVPAYSRESVALFQSAAASGLVIDNARLRLTRLTGEAARDVTVPIAPGQDSLVINMVVPITGSQELFTALLELRQGEQVLFSGTALVLAIAGAPPLTPAIPLIYVGPVSQVVSQLVLVTSGLSGIVGQLLSQPVVVQALTAAGDPVAGVPINWTAVAGDPQLGAASSITDAAGLASVPVTLGTAAGTQAVQATANGVTPLVVNLSALADQAAQLAILQQPSTTGVLGGVLATQPVVRLLDRFGNAVYTSGVPVSATPTVAGFLLGGANTAVTDANGVATFSGLFLTGLAGSTALRFTSGQLAPVTSSAITLGILASVMRATAR